MGDKQKLSVASDQNVRLLRALAEELKLPLLQIARGSELARISNQPEQLKDIEVTADAALRLIDSYLFSTQVLVGQQSLSLEPVSVAASMYDTAQYLRNMSKLYDCDIDVSVSGKCGLAMAHPTGLQAALTSLAYSIINTSTGKKPRILLTAKKTTEGILAGVVATNSDITKDALSIARKLYGDARRPMAGFTHNNGAGIYVADALFAAMASELKVSSGRGKAGFIATLLPSQQLVLL